MKRARIPASAGILLALILIACGTEAQKQDSGAPRPSTSIASTLGTVEVGTLARIDDMISSNRGKWVLVNIWATWCRPCVAETPDLVATYDSLKSEPFYVLGISTDLMTIETESEAVSRVQTFGKEHRVSYPLVIYSGALDELTSRFSLSGAIPATILYDPQGQEVERWVGRLAPADFAKIMATVS